MTTETFYGLRDAKAGIEALEDKLEGLGEGGGGGGGVPPELEAQVGSNTSEIAKIQDKLYPVGEIAKGLFLRFQEAINGAGQLTDFEVIGDRFYATVSQGGFFSLGTIDTPVYVDLTPTGIDLSSGSHPFLALTKTDTHVLVFANKSCYRYTINADNSLTLDNNDGVAIHTEQGYSIMHSSISIDGAVFVNDASGHVFKSTDSGATWEQVLIVLPDNVGIETDIYSTNLSTDGISLIQITTAFEFNDDYDIVDTYVKLNVSTDGGKTWDTRKLSFDSDGSKYRTVAVSGNTIFASGEVNFCYYSEDFGVSWTKIAFPLSASKAEVRTSTVLSKDNKPQFNFFINMGSKDEGPSSVHCELSGGKLSVVGDVPQLHHARSSKIIDGYVYYGSNDLCIRRFEKSSAIDQLDNALDKVNSVLPGLEKMVWGHDYLLHRHDILPLFPELTDYTPYSSPIKDFKVFNGQYHATIRDSGLYSLGNSSHSAIQDKTPRSINTDNDDGYFDTLAVTKNCLLMFFGNKCYSYVIDKYGNISLANEDGLEVFSTTLNDSVLISSAASGDNQIVFAGDEKGTIYKSIDDGVTWTISFTPPFPVINDLEKLVIDGNTVVTIFKNGETSHEHLIKSIDGGVTWTSDSIPASDVFITTAIALADNNIFIGTDQQYCLQSENLGATWTKTVISPTHRIERTTAAVFVQGGISPRVAFTGTNYSGGGSFYCHMYNGEITIVVDEMVGRSSCLDIIDGILHIGTDRQDILRCPEISLIDRHADLINKLEDKVEELAVIIDGLGGGTGPSEATSVTIKSEDGSKSAIIAFGADGSLALTMGNNVTTLMDAAGNFIAAGDTGVMAEV